MHRGGDQFYAWSPGERQGSVATGPVSTCTHTLSPQQRRGLLAATGRAANPSPSGPHTHPEEQVEGEHKVLDTLEAAARHAAALQL